MEPSLIEARLERLERQNLYLKRTGAGALVLVWIAMVLPLAGLIVKNDHIEAERFVVAKQRNDPRALLVITEKDAQYLIFHDQQGRERAVFGVTEEGLPVFGLLGSDEKARIALSVNGDDEPQLGLVDSNHKLRAALKLTGDQPRLSFLSSEGQQQALFEVTEQYGPMLLTFDAEGQISGRFPARAADNAEPSAP